MNKTLHSFLCCFTEGDAPAQLADGRVQQGPIITITSDSPEIVLPTVSSWLQKRHSDASDRSEKSDKSDVSRAVPSESFSLQRSASDSKINYSNNDEVEEVPGSVFYITARGHINYQVSAWVRAQRHHQSAHESTCQCCGATSHCTVYAFLVQVILQVILDMVQEHSVCGCCAGDPAGGARRGAPRVLAAHVRRAPQHPQLSHRPQRNRQARAHQESEAPLHCFK